MLYPTAMSVSLCQLHRRCYARPLLRRLQSRPVLVSLAWRRLPLPLLLLREWCCLALRIGQAGVLQRREHVLQPKCWSPLVTCTKRSLRSTVVMPIGDTMARRALSPIVTLCAYTRQMP